MKKEERNKLAKSFADEIFKDADMAMQENIDGKNEVHVVASMVLGHILETHDILPKSPESATETWWIARDYDGELYMSNREPELVGDRGIFTADESYSVQLPEESFPSIAPKKCYKAKIIITPIEDE